MMDRLRAACWALGLAHRARHDDFDRDLAGLNARDQADQETLQRLREETKAMHRRLAALEERQNIQRRRQPADA